MKDYVVLSEIKEYLEKNPLEIAIDDQFEFAGRGESAMLENVLVDSLKNQFGDKIQTFREYSGISEKKKECRSWYDILVHDPNGIVPVNIKFSQCKQQDNCCAYAALAWSLTNVEMSLAENINARQACTILVDCLENLKDMGMLEKFEPNREYGFLVIDKNDMSHVIVNGIRGLKQYAPNGSASNRPFQSNWSINNEYVERPFAETWQLIQEALQIGFKKDPEAPLKEFINGEQNTIEVEHAIEEAEQNLDFLAQLEVEMEMM